jgi:hypothetical protein
MKIRTDFAMVVKHHFVEPNAKSVSERDWPMSHQVRPNPVSTWRSLDS